MYRADRQDQRKCHKTGKSRSNPRLQRIARGFQGWRDNIRPKFPFFSFQSIKQVQSISTRAAYPAHKTLSVSPDIQTPRTADLSPPAACVCRWTTSCRPISSQFEPLSGIKPSSLQIIGFRILTLHSTPLSSCYIFVDSNQDQSRWSSKET